MTTDLFRSCGEALYGQRWQTDLAAALRVSDRHIRRLASGDPVGDGIWADVMALMLAQASLLQQLARDVDSLK
jgi:hypothetical protein